MVECFKLYAGCLGVVPLGWLLVLDASVDVPTASDAVISVDGFTLRTKCGVVPGGFHMRFSLGKII